MLAYTSALVRRSTIEHPTGFTVCLAPSGAGKKPAYDIACADPCEAVEDVNEGVPQT